MYKNLVRIEHDRLYPPQQRGRPRILTFDDSFDCILKVVQTGMQWRQLQPTKVSHITVFKQMHMWIHAGVFRTAYTRLLRLYCRQRRSRYYCIDSTYVKNIYGRDCVGRNPTDRGRRATKLSAVVDDLGVPHSLIVTAANISDQKLLQPTIQDMLSSCHRGKELFADKGYDSAMNRRICKSYGFNDRIFKRRTTNGKRTHAKRGVVERYFSWHDKYRRLLVRYEQNVQVYLGMTFMTAGIRLNQIFSKFHIASKAES